MKVESDWMDNAILHILYCSWVFPKKKWAQVEWKIYDTSRFWNISLFIFYKEGNVHSFNNDFLKVGDMNASLTQNNWVQVTQAQTQRNRLLHMVINQLFSEVHSHSNSLSRTKQTNQKFSPEATVEPLFSAVGHCNTPITLLNLSV